MSLGYCWCCSDKPPLRTKSNVRVYADWLVETERLEGESKLVKIYNDSLCSFHETEIAAELLKRESAR